MILVDSNVLVYAINTASSKRELAQSFLQTHNSEIAVAHQNILESIRVLTHPKYEKPMTVQQAIAALERITTHCEILIPNELTERLTMHLLKEYSLKADNIFDAYLAATALSWGIDTIATDNTKDFMLIREIKILNPFKAS